VCIQSQCAAKQLPAGAVDCVAGKCVAGFACDAAGVTCRMAAPSCPAGEVPTINASGNCWSGTCAPAVECKGVTDCNACAGADTCATFQTQMGARYHCVTIPAGCGPASCDCLGPGTCTAPYRQCTPFSGVRGFSCSCPNC
jgi:hypothetical protein